MATEYQTKRGSASFANKLQRLVMSGRVSQARYLFSERESRCGHSSWNPAYGILAEGGARCAYGMHLIGEP
jgi:hypothetical protein